MLMNFSPKDTVSYLLYMSMDEAFIELLSEEIDDELQSISLQPEQLSDTKSIST